ncbi:hypothetical protein [Streptomyces prasinus]
MRKRVLAFSAACGSGGAGESAAVSVVDFALAVVMAADCSEVSRWNKEER